MRKKGTLPLISFVVVIIGLLVAVLVAGWKPALGLDLQGGVSLVLEPKVVEGQEGTIKAEDLEQTKQLIETRVNAIGVAEPEVTIQGNNIVVQIPGVDDQQRVFDLVGKTAELRFRPVLEVLGKVPANAEETIAKLRSKLKMPEGLTAAKVVEDEIAKNPQPTGATGTDGATVTTGGTGPSAVDPAATGAAATGADGASVSGTSGTAAASPTSAKVNSLRAKQTTTTAAPDASTTTAAPDPSVTTTTAAQVTTTTKYVSKNQYGIDVTSKEFSELRSLEKTVDDAKAGDTPPEADKADQPVTLRGKPDKNGESQRYKLGPTALTGTTIEDARAGLQQGGWVVNPTFKDGADGIDKFNEWATKCNSGATECPSLGGQSKGALAVVLDGTVISAPSINEAKFQRDQIQISGSFTEQEAKDFALALRYGSLPIVLEPQQIQTVSATLGEGALRAGLIAGGIGIGLVILFLLAYYRLLGAVTVGSLLLSSALLWVIVATLGQTQGLALTLAGIVGIIVSIGVSLDSSVVYFENLKEDVRNGRTLRSVQALSFKDAYGTIVKADLSSLIGALVLYFLSVGPVRGFAFYLGLSTILDLTMVYFFVRPVTAVLARSKLGGNPRTFGIPLDRSDVVPDTPLSAATVAPSATSDSLTGALVGSSSGGGVATLIADEPTEDTESLDNVEQSSDETVDRDGDISTENDDEEAPQS